LGELGSKPARHKGDPQDDSLDASGGRAHTGDSLGTVQEFENGVSSISCAENEISTKS
jgi:hypothetical protein